MGRVVCGSHSVSSLVVVGDLDVGGSGRCPGEAVAPLVVDTDAVLSLAISVKLFEMIARRDPQVVNGLRGVEDQQLAVRNSLKVGAKLADERSLPDEFGLLVPKCLDHLQNVTRCVTNVERRHHSTGQYLRAEVRSEQ